MTVETRPAGWWDVVRLVWSVNSALFLLICFREAVGR